MAYKAGQLGAAETIALLFILTFPPIFLTSPAQRLEDGAGLAWLIVVVSGIVPIAVLFALLYAVRSMQGDLFCVTEYLVGRAGAWIVALIYTGMFLLNAALLLRQFAENTLLTALPVAEFDIIIASYAVVVAILVYLGLEGFSRAAYVLMPFSVIALLAVVLLLIPSYNVNHLFPWQGTGLGQVLKVGLLTGGMHFVIIVLLILRPSLHNLKTIKTAALFGFGGTILLKSIATLSFTLVFGSMAGREKVLPFFEMARIVYLSRYLQRLEALFILLWVIIGTLGIAASLYVGLYLITRLLNLPTMRPLIPVVTMIIVELASLPPDITTVIELERSLSKTFFNAGVYGIPAILLVAALFKARKKGAGTCA